jgi:flagellar basal-body rod modification protein FlgD
MSVPAINTTGIPATVTAGSDQSARTRIPAKLLDQGDFLKLVVAQMTNQDPLKPQTDTEFISQMTTFTTLEQTKTMQGDIAQMKTQQEVLKGMSLMNREVVVNDGDAGNKMGVVTGLDMDGQNVKVVIGGKSYALSDVLAVHLTEQQN